MPSGELFFRRGNRLLVVMMFLRDFIQTGVIDANYMNSRFTKNLKALQDGTETAAVFHKQEEQK